MRYVSIIRVYENTDKVYKGILPEAEERDRSSLTITRKKDHVEVKISAKDATALRASFNGIMKTLTVFERMAEIGQENQDG